MNTKYQREDRMFSNSEIIKEGIFYYNKQVPCDIRIFKHNMKYGSGDYEDESEIHNDLEGEFYYIEYGSTIERGKFVSISNAFEKLEDAISNAEISVNSKIDWKDL